MFAPDPPPVAQSYQPDVIEVVGTRAGQSLKIDRRTYRVQQTPHSAQKDSIQLLRGLPAVTITPDDQIMLLGSGKVTIKGGGRTVADPDTTAELRARHGSGLERIEVLTNPSAQYSSQGTAGLINFVLRQRQDDGLSGTAMTEVSSRGGGYVDATLKNKRGRWTYEIHSGGRTGTVRRSHYHKLRSVEDAAGGSTIINTETGGGPPRGTEGEGSAKISYELDPRTSVSARIMGGSARDAATNNAVFAGVTSDFHGFDERQRFHTAVSFLISELNFDHKGRKEGGTLTASLRVFGNPRQQERNDAAFSNGGTLSTDKLKRFLFADGQIDWQHPMRPGQILSVGALWNYARMQERYRVASSAGVLGEPVFDQFRGVEDTLAAYATFQQPLGTWTVMPGVRMERNSRHVTSPGEPDVDVARTYLFPTLHVQHPLSKRLELTLSYSKRINRPQLNDLRPYALVQDVITVKQANPHLKDETLDAYEINLKYRCNKLDAGLIVYDRETSHLISQSYTAVNGVNVVRIVNSGHSRDRRAEIDLSTPLAFRVKLMASVNLFSSRVPVGDGAGRTNEDTFRYTTNGTLEWDGPDRGNIPGDVAQLQWTYNGPWRQFQLHYLAWNQLNLSYTHSFSRTASLTGTATYNGPNRHRLFAPLVQEYFAERSPVEFKIKILKTFGNP
jgi:outer membrane receptor protein involved in Fe transport